MSLNPNDSAPGFLGTNVLNKSQFRSFVEYLLGLVVKKGDEKKPLLLGHLTLGVEKCHFFNQKERLC